jgi:Flp pilus assembly protein TadD
VRVHGEPSAWRAAERIRTQLLVGRADDALAEVRSALAQWPHDLDLLCLGSLACDCLRRSREALELADLAAAVEPGSARVHLLRSRALSALRRHRAAVAAAEEAVRLAPEEAGTHVRLSEALCADPRPGWRRRAVTAAERAVELAPEHADTHCALGDSLIRTGRVARAEASYRVAVAIEPESSRLRLRLAGVLEHRGRHEEAAELHAGTLRLAPETAAARTALRRIWGRRAVATRRILERHFTAEGVADIVPRLPWSVPARGQPRSARGCLVQAGTVSLLVPILALVLLPLFIVLLVVSAVAGHPLARPLEVDAALACLFLPVVVAVQYPEARRRVAERSSRSAAGGSPAAAARRLRLIVICMIWVCVAVAVALVWRR